MNSLKKNSFTVEAEERIVTQLDRILESPIFTRKKNSRNLLNFLVREVLAGQAKRLNRDHVRTGCFGKHATAESVSTEKVRLQKALRRYYSEFGKPDPIQIGIPSAGFVPTFEWFPSADSVDEELFSGREREIKRLQKAYERACVGESNLACVAADAGMGKTTLVNRFVAETLRSNPTTMVVCVQSPTTKDSAGSYLPFHEALRLLIDTDNDLLITHVKERMKVIAGSWLRLLAHPDTATLERVPPSLKELASILRLASERKPIILFIEDLHLADESTARILAHVINDRPQRIMIIATYRQQEMSTRTGMALHTEIFQLTRARLCDLIELGPLALVDVQEYIAKRFAGNILPLELSILVHRKTGGNPLFMTEVLQYLVAHNVITNADLERRWRLALPIPDIGRELPGSISTMIQMNIARLAEHERQLLLAGALQGEEFESAVLSSVLLMPSAEIEHTLEAVERKHHLILFVSSHRQSQNPPSVRYRFAHVLYQTTFSELFNRLPSYAQQWAKETATALEHFYEGQVGCYVRASEGDAAAGSRLPIQLANLYELAGDPGRALPYYLTAAKGAVSQFAHHTAGDVARHALALLLNAEDTPANRQLEVTFCLILANSILSTRGYADSELAPLYLRALRLTGDVFLKLKIMYGLWIYHVASGRLSVALRLIREVLEAAKAFDNASLLVEPSQALGTTLIQVGELKDASDFLYTALRQYDAQNSQRTFVFYELDPAALIRSQYARVLWLQGLPDHAIRVVEDALRHGSIHPESRAYVLVFAADISHFRGDFEKALMYSEDALLLSREYGLAQELAWATMINAWAIAQRGDLERAIEIFAQNIEFYKSIGSQVALTKFLTLFATVYYNAGRVDEGLAKICDALTFMAESGERYYESELLRVKGELLLKQIGRNSSVLDEVRGLFEAALCVARRQRAKSLELRAMVSLCRLARTTGREHAAVVQQLRELHSSFSEGHDTVDLMSARTVLEESVIVSATDAGGVFDCSGS